MHRPVLLLCLLALLIACDAPQNYDECVLHEMKGQSKEMVGHARDICEAKFPFEKKLYGYEDYIDVGWWTNADSLHVQINKNYGKYRITRYKASFSKVACSQIRGYLSTYAYTITKIFEFGRGNESASVYVGGDVTAYKCMRTDDIFGIRSN
jgi:hypothetical protein